MKALDSEVKNEVKKEEGKKIYIVKKEELKREEPKRQPVVILPKPMSERKIEQGN